MALFRSPYLLAVCVFLAGAFGCKPTPPASSESLDLDGLPLFKLTGKNYTHSYLADPVISRGEFEVWQAAKVPMPIRISSVKYIHGDSILPIPEFSVYLEGDTASISPDSFAIPPQTTVSFWVSFPAIPYSEFVPEVPKVEISVRALGTDLKAVSEIEMVRRIPRH